MSWQALYIVLSLKESVRSL